MRAKYIANMRGWLTIQPRLRACSALASKPITEQTAASTSGNCNRRMECRSTSAKASLADAKSMRLAQTATDKRLIAFCERQTDETLARDCVLPRPNRKPPPTEVGRVLEHLFQHQIHHRGQAHAMLAGTRLKPPQLDEFFLAGEQDLRRDELRALGLPET